ncbi:hypothetical protein DPEC_G00069410 [Dallia pectoralis]|uniref:Uncharacterized protein n=1 Tax=Dallia pectoralis TaxID=75939 RepID=A0ACC2H1X4_DALPE|nr:hypothetical protein DPEC_G00069410 [Dallia pectoralis]
MFLAAATPQCCQASWVSLGMMSLSGVDNAQVCPRTGWPSGASLASLQRAGSWTLEARVSASPGRLSDEPLKRQFADKLIVGCGESPSGLVRGVSSPRRWQGRLRAAAVASTSWVPCRKQFTARDAVSFLFGKGMAAKMSSAVRQRAGPDLSSVPGGYSRGPLSHWRGQGRCRHCAAVISGRLPMAQMTPSVPKMTGPVVCVVPVGFLGSLSHVVSIACYVYAVIPL